MIFPCISWKKEVINEQLPPKIPIIPKVHVTEKYMQIPIINKNVSNELKAMFEYGQNHIVFDPNTQFWFANGNLKICVEFLNVLSSRVMPVAFRHSEDVPIKKQKLLQPFKLSIGNNIIYVSSICNNNDLVLEQDIPILCVKLPEYTVIIVPFSENRNTFIVGAQINDVKEECVSLPMCGIQVESQFPMFSVKNICSILKCAMKINQITIPESMTFYWYKPSSIYLHPFSKVKFVKDQTLSDTDTLFTVTLGQMRMQIEF